MKAPPLLKGVPSSLVILLGIPDQHLRTVVNSHLLAVCGDDAFWIVQQVIGIDDGNTHIILFTDTFAGEDGTNVLVFTQEIEHPAEFVVAGFGGHEVVETGDFVEGWDSAAPVGWNAVTGMADEEGEMELSEDFGRNDCWVSGFWSCVVWIWSFFRAMVAIDFSIRGAIG
jgi:hypothetical protein